ncbi:hypothetical protein Pla52n_62210 [Stieleria varia]|uniref:SWIM-type domain-containing protein n=2 Tax=Stieleria varia TaxID=2528005 RepID=A0A5C5ZZ73_9BACT|nr:hypothetical protein Pla52n_62210 [Stieleria varia]
MGALQLDEDFVDSQAPNANATSNGRGLVVKGKFVVLHQSDDETLLFGECSGSGKSNYVCSCDFIRPNQPTYRCTCPSRQFPCKHCLGLMYAFVGGKKFTVADVPEDLAAKREKLQERKEKQKEQSDKPRKVNKAALSKKLQAQLNGLDLLETFTFDLVRSGMGNTNAKTARDMQQRAKQLGDAYLPGAQAALHQYTNLFVGADGKYDGELSSQQRETIYTEALDQLTRLSAIIKHGRRYLQARVDDPELPPETDSPIAAWLGHAWQLRDLRAAGLVIENAELIQLAFHSHDDHSRQEYIDTGIWMNLANGAIQLTQNFRPYKAAKYIRSEDSFFKIAVVKELCVYPGTVNPRVRWDEFETREITAKDFQSVAKFASADFESAMKSVRSGLKNPLSEKRPVVALRYKSLGQLPDGELAIEDAKGTRIVMTEAGLSEEPPSCHLMPMLPETLASGQTMVGRIHQDLDSKTLRLKPLSIITDTQVFRLTL